MKKEYILIENERYKLVIKLEEMDLDYYTDVYIELVLREKSIVLLKDNLLALKNIVEQYEMKAIDSLDINLNESELGILLNDYYRGFYEDDISSHLIFDDQDLWIGEKYCCYQGREYAIWIYRYGGNIIMKVTPIFDGFEKDDYAQEYYRFIQGYKDVFREVIPLQALTMAKKTIIQLYNRYMDNGYQHI